MSLSSLNRSNPGFLQSVPVYLSHLVFLLLSVKTIDFLAVENVHAVIFLVPLFYWTIHKPALMPLWFVFISGLIIDFAVHSFIGLHAFGFIIFTMILQKNRRVILSQPIFYHAIIFAAVVALFEIIRFVIFGFFSWSLMAFAPALTAFIVTIILFFPSIIILKTIHRVINR
jgi:rod shape-determining protein MreD